MPKQRYRKTVFVLGAGASCPYGFPTAGEVRQLIVQRNSHVVREIVGRLNTTAGLVTKVRAFVERFHQLAEIERFQREFFQSQITSVDAFVQSRKGEFEPIAKRMAAAILLYCEAAANLDDDWYQLLRNVLLENGPEFSAERCSIITFNYDRSLERYLWLAIRYSFGLPEGIAYQHIQRLNLHHVYGSLGELRDGSKGSLVPWGSTTDQQIDDAANEIQLMKPRHSRELSRIAKWLRSADVICFLGFGFWPENIDLLLAHINRSSQIYASARNLPETVKDRFNGQVSPSRVMWGEQWTARDCLLNWNLF